MYPIGVDIPSFYYDSQHNSFGEQPFHANIDKIHEFSACHDKEIYFSLAKSYTIIKLYFLILLIECNPQ